MADIIRIGDIVTDENQSGIVLRISNNLVTWRSSTTGRVFRTSMSKLRKDDGRSQPIESQPIEIENNEIGDEEVANEISAEEPVEEMTEEETVEEMPEEEVEFEEENLEVEEDNDDTLIREVIHVINLHLSSGVENIQSISKDYNYAFVDMDNDGFISTLDIVAYVQTILNESSTSEADKDILNLQLERLDIPIAFSEGRRQKNKQRPMFRGSFLLTFKESNQIKLSNTLPEDLVNVSGQMQCLGKDNAYPCYFVPSEIEEPLTRRENNSTNRGMISNRRNINFTVSENRAFYSFDINNLESNLGMNLNSDFIILATCGTNETTVGFERLFQTGNDSVLVHVMGISTIDSTVNYCETGETPKFFLHNTENNNEMQIPNIGRKPFIYNGNYTIP